MVSHEVSPLWGSRKIWVQLAWIIVVVETLTATLIKLIPRVLGGWPLRRVLVVSFLRSAGRIPFSWLRSTKLPTGQSIDAYCKSNDLTCKSQVISCESTNPPLVLHTISIKPDTSNGRILLYLHGGAYVNPIDTQGQLPFAIDCAEAAGVNDLVILEYTLAPALKYPGQLIQAVEALVHLLQDHEAGEIIIGGDSAGGNILLALLAHIKRPHPLVNPLPPLENFYAAFLISPWVTMSDKSKSFTTCSSIDYIRAAKMKVWTQMWEPNSSDIWADFLIGGADFWKDTPVDNVLVTVGGWECFLDDVLEMGTQLGARVGEKDSPVELFVGKNEVHVQCALDKAVGLPYGGSASRILDWLRSMPIRCEV